MKLRKKLNIFSFSFSRTRRRAAYHCIDRSHMETQKHTQKNTVFPKKKHTHTQRHTLTPHKKKMGLITKKKTCADLT